jgi:hypothetical protein
MVVRDTARCPSRDGAQLLGSCANWLLWRGNSRPRYVGDAPWRSTHIPTAVAPEPIDQIGSGSLHRLGERAIDDEVGSGARLSAGLEMNTTWAATFSGTPVHPIGFKAIADLKASGVLRSMLCQTSPWNKYFAPSRQWPARRGTRRLEPSASPPGGGCICAKIIPTAFTGLPR